MENTVLNGHYIRLAHFFDVHYATVLHIRRQYHTPIGFPFGYIHSLIHAVGFKLLPLKPCAIDTTDSLS